MNKILVTGGAGYIGSHTCVELLNAGYEVTVLDNLCNSGRESLRRVQRITNKALDFVQGDIRDRADVVDVLRRSAATAVIHFAGLKAVGESVVNPLAYYDNNVVGTIRLLEAMAECGIKSLVFSSSATVYGEPQKLPLAEDHPLSATNPYGRSKLVIEHILRDLFRSDPSWCFGILRYFNPVGAHASGLIGEDPQGTPNNLLPFLAQVAVGKRDFLNVWGNDYATRDGTGVRDYVHVVDLALGHLAALRKLQTARPFDRRIGNAVPIRIVLGRVGDVAACYADSSLAHALLGWQAQRDLEAMCVDAWRWQAMNPNGYQEIR